MVWPEKKKCIEKCLQMQTGLFETNGRYAFIRIRIVTYCQKQI